MSVYNISGPLSLSEILCVWDTSKKGKFGSLKEKENTSLSSPDTPCSTKSYLNMRQCHKTDTNWKAYKKKGNNISLENKAAAVPVVQLDPVLAANGSLLFRQSFSIDFNHSQSISIILNWFQSFSFYFNHSQFISIILNLFLSFSIDFNYSQLISTILNWFQLIGGYSWYWADLPRTRRVQFSIGHLLHFGITLWYIWISLSHIWITFVELFHSLCKI